LQVGKKTAEGERNRTTILEVLQENGFLLLWETPRKAFGEVSLKFCHLKEGE
jgi:hypothetical protein